MTYEADANLTPDKVFILKSVEIADYGVAKQEQLLDLMAEASELYPDASASQVIEFAKQRLLTRNVLSSYQEITAPPLPSLLELTSGPVSEEPAVVEEAPEEPVVEDEPEVEAPVAEELEVEEEEPVVEDEAETEEPVAEETEEDTQEEVPAVEEEPPFVEETNDWYAPEELTEEVEAEEDTYSLPDLEEEVAPAEDVAEEAPEEPSYEPELAEEPVTYEQEELPAEEPAEEAEYTLEEEVEDHVGEEQPGSTPGADSYGEDDSRAYPAEEEGSSEETPAVEQDESPLVTSYQAAPTVLKKDRRWVGLLEAAGRLDAKGD